jgi:hypothetical protein
MKKLMLATALMLTSCTSKDPVCDVAKKVSTVIASEVSTLLECKNQAAIETTINGLLKDNKVCEASTQSVIGELICPTLVTGLMTGALKQIPATWQCSGGPLKDTAKDKLLELCKKSI